VIPAAATLASTGANVDLAGFAVLVLIAGAGLLLTRRFSLHR